MSSSIYSQEVDLGELESLMSTELFGWASRPYHYEELPTPTSIRVLEIHPASQNRQDSVSCSLRVVDLEQKPVYAALSYTWGAPRNVYLDGEDIPSPVQAAARDRKIICDDCFIRVTANCHDFLEQFQHVKQVAPRGRPLGGARNPGSASAAEMEIMSLVPQDMGLIWIDAICINQESMEERAAQVRMMGNIYRQAYSILLWLGPGDVFSRDAMEVLVNLSNVSKEQAMQARTYEPSEPRAYAKLGIPVVTQKQWQSVYAFLHRSWFSRAWVVQEILQARKAVVFCGQLCLPWYCLMNAVTIILECEWHGSLRVMETQPATSDSSEELSRSQFAKYLTKRKEGSVDRYKLLQTGEQGEVALVLIGIQDIKGRFGRDFYANKAIRPSISFQAIMSGLASAQCSLPADRIYAFLGIPEEAIWREFKVDYTRPVAETYLSATWCMIHSSRSVRILSAVRDKSRKVLEDLPSWVPDFSAYGGATALDWGGDESFMGFQPVIFNAASGLTWDHIDSRDDTARVLPVKGICCATIDAAREMEFSRLASLQELFSLAESTPPRDFWRILASADYRNPDDVEVEEIPDKLDLCILFMLAEQHWDMLRASRDLPKHERPFHDADQKFRDSARTYLKFSDAHRADTPHEFLERHIETSNRLLTLSRTTSLANIAEENLVTLSTFCSYMETRLSSNVEYEGVVYAAKNDMRRVLDRVARLNFYRALFRTTDGGLGKGPFSASKGDEIWVLSGSKVPYVLRPVKGNESSFELIGEAYACGIMFGEAVKDGRSGLRTISLI